VREVLNLEFEGQKWLERGILTFSQFYDSGYTNSLTQTTYCPLP